MWLISSETLCGGCWVRDVIGLFISEPGSQLSDHMSVVSPLPILLTSPCTIMSLPSRIACQICDGWWPNSASNKDVSGK